MHLEDFILTGRATSREPQFLGAEAGAAGGKRRLRCITVPISEVSPSGKPQHRQYAGQKPRKFLKKNVYYVGYEPQPHPNLNRQKPQSY